MIALCVPARGIVDMAFAAQLLVIARDSAAAGHPVRLIYSQGSQIHTNRNDITRTALDDARVSHLFWLDDDMAVPGNVIRRLLAHQLPVVGASYARRRPPFAPTALKRVGEPLTPATGLEAVHAIGFGCVLVERGVFERLPFPWFQVPWQEGEGQWTEDVYFCERAAEHGIQATVDHDLSYEVGHLTQEYVYLTKAQG